jgi:hypothetical protein
MKKKSGQFHLCVRVRVCETLKNKLVWKFFFLFLSLAPQPNLGLDLLLKIRLNFLEASQQFSFYRVGLLAPLPTPTLEDQASVFISPRGRVATHFSRLVRHAWVTVGLFLFPGHHTGRSGTSTYLKNHEHKFCSCGDVTFAFGSKGTRCIPRSELSTAETRYGTQYKYLFSEVWESFKRGCLDGGLGTWLDWLLATQWLSKDYTCYLSSNCTGGWIQV